MVHNVSARKKSTAHRGLRNRSGSTRLFPVIVAILLLLLVGGVLFTFRDNIYSLYRNTIRAQIRRRVTQPNPPPRPIPHGKMDFTISGNNIRGPRFTKGTLDPYDPALNTSQTIRISVVSGTPVTELYGTMLSDKKSSKIPFKLTEGTATQGVWQGVWLVNDSYLYNYTLIIFAINSAGSNSVTVTLR
jgi:hypothetical protein